MDSTVALAAAAVVLLLIIFLLSILRKQFGEQEKEDEPLVQEAAVVRRPAAGRNNRVRNRHVQRHHDGEGRGVEVDDDEIEAEPKPILDLGDAKVGKKKLAKLEAKAEKKAAREMEEKEREERKQKEVEFMKERQKMEELENELEKEKEEQLKREILERERREQEEYLKMKAAFSIDEQGFEAGEEVPEENLLQRFIDFVKGKKIVLLEELAAEFQLKTQDAIDRLQKLVADGSLTGVIDDRGKFIYISRDEMESVAKFIRQRGRVSLIDLAESSNQLIQLGSKVTV
nr:EOG090X0N9E [Polyphemus pediculus]